MGHGDFSAEIETILGKLGWPPHIEHTLSPVAMANKPNKQVNCIIGFTVTRMKVWVRGNNVLDIVARGNFPGKVKQVH